LAGYDLVAATAEMHTMAIDVRRKVAEARHLYEYDHLGTAWIGVERERVTLGFSEAKGRGKSHFRLTIEPSSYRLVVEAMLRTNAEEAIKAFAAVLKDGIRAKEYAWSPPEEDEPAAVA
jgi:hypothetical protein